MSDQEENKLADLLIKNVLPSFEKELILQSLLVYQVDGEDKKCILINRSLQKCKDNPITPAASINHIEDESEEAVEAEGEDQERKAISPVVKLEHPASSSGDGETSNSRRKRKIGKPTRIPQITDINVQERPSSPVETETKVPLSPEVFASPLEIDEMESVNQDTFYDHENNRIIIDNVGSEDGSKLTYPLANLNLNNCPQLEDQQKIINEILNIDQILSNNHASSDKVNLNNLLCSNTLNLLDSVNKQNLGPLLANSMLQQPSENNLKSVINNNTSNNCNNPNANNLNNKAQAVPVNCTPLDLSNSIQQSVGKGISIQLSSPSTHLNQSFLATPNGVPRPIRPRLAHLTMVTNSQLGKSIPNIMHLSPGNTSATSLIGNFFNKINVFPSNYNGTNIHSVPTSSITNNNNTAAINISNNFQNKSGIVNKTNITPAPTLQLKKPIMANTNPVQNKIALPMNNFATILNNNNNNNTNVSKMMIGGGGKGDERPDDNSCQSRRYAKSFVCNQCKSVFTSLSALCEHTFDIHKSFRCTICDAQFTQRSNLQRHSLRHVGFKPFICNICSKAYYRKDHLVRHIELSHPGANPRVSITVKLSSAECLDFLERNPPNDASTGQKNDTDLEDEEMILMDDSQYDEDSETKSKLMKIDEDIYDQEEKKEGMGEMFTDFNKANEPVKLNTC